MTPKQMFSPHKQLDLLLSGASPNISEFLLTPEFLFLSLLLFEASFPPADATEPSPPTSSDLFPPLPPNQKPKYRLNFCHHVFTQLG